MSPLRCRVLVAGEAAGDVIVLDEPLSLWGGLDPATARVIDRRHPQVGAELAGRIVVMPSGRGSSSASSVLLEAIRRGRAPAAFVLERDDGILALGAVVGRELYDATVPIVVLPSGVGRVATTGQPAVLSAAGDLTIGAERT